MPKTYDATALIEELELDQEDIVELLTDFREFLVETLPQLEAAINSENITDSRSIAHSVKGSAGNLRVNAVYETAKQMQDVADENDVAQLKKLWPLLKKHSDDFLAESENI
jgi:HPt (histidine-containing phosphotransfer) domain-containing protein